MTRGYISLGSNIDREHNISSALRALKKQFGNLIISSTYETEPVGFSGNLFYNLVVGIDSDLEVKAVAKLLKQIENDHGRIRNSQKFAARTLDLDLLLYGDLVISDGRLQIPRDEITKYAFVLEPLAEIAPDLKHPITHEKYAALWDKFDKIHINQKRIPLSTGNFHT
jgi:2-amino-4-hydroxy-6-hydroxymethyldihydropteridine diphosphokinase